MRLRSGIVGSASAILIAVHTAAFAQTPSAESCASLARQQLPGTKITTAEAISTGTFTVSGLISGTGSLTKTGAGTLALTAVNSYAGNTAVQAGMLKISNPYLTDNADVLLSTGAALDLQFTGAADAIRSLVFNDVAQVLGSWGAVGNTNAAYHTTLITGTGVLQVTAGPVVGDYNNDGEVDSSDYLTWRSQFGAATIANRDPNITGLIGQADYASWRAHFGELAASGSAANLNSGNGATVPEPATITMLLLAAAFLPASRHRNTSIRSAR